MRKTSEYSFEKVDVQNYSPENETIFLEPIFLNKIVSRMLLYNDNLKT